MALRLRAGANRLLLHMEELCERDTTFFVELRWRDARPATLAVPGEQLALQALRRTMASARLDREAYRKFVAALELPNDARARLLALTPQTYLGAAAELAREAVAGAGKTPRKSKRG